MARSSGTRKGNGVGSGPGIAYGSKGDGWGGAAKGAGAVSDKAPQFSDGNTAAVGRDQPETERTAVLRDHLFHLALNAERQETQLAAAQAYLNRVEGMPVARNVNIAVDDIAALDDAALAARREAIERGLRAGVAGAAPPADADGSDSVRH